MREQASEKPPTSCCPSNSWGKYLDAPYDAKDLTVGASKIEPVSIGPTDDLEIFIAKPSPSSKAPTQSLLVFTDIYGPQNRVLGICKKLARDLGMYVVLVDCFRGQTAETRSDFAAWMKEHPYRSGGGANTHPVEDDIRWTMEYLSERYGIASFGAVGFCWGVWAVTKAIASGVDFKAAVGFHPSILLEEMMFEGDTAAMAEMAAEKVPLLYCVSGNDPANLKPPSGRVASAILASGHGNEKLGKSEPRCIEFPDMVHGWVCRGDTNQAEVKRDAEKALKLASKFIGDWMNGCYSLWREKYIGLMLRTGLF